MVWAITMGPLLFKIQSLNALARFSPQYIVNLRSADKGAHVPSATWCRTSQSMNARCSVRVLTRTAFHLDTTRPYTRPLLPPVSNLVPTHLLWLLQEVVLTGPCTVSCLAYRSHSSSSYSLTVFSPSGKLVQIEHALAAVGQGTTSLGIKGVHPAAQSCMGS